MRAELDEAVQKVAAAAEELAAVQQRLEEAESSQQVCASSCSIAFVAAPTLIPPQESAQDFAAQLHTAADKAASLQDQLKLSHVEVESRKDEAARADEEVKVCQLCNTRALSNADSRTGTARPSGHVDEGGR